VTVEVIVLCVTLTVQFKAQILSIDRGDDSCNEVEPANSGDVEPTDEEQVAGETSVSSVIS